MTNCIQVYTYPYELTPDDKLTDGPEGSPEGTTFKITEKTLLIWIDLHPDMRFIHDTQYIFISATGASVTDGHWWPELNGRRILYGERNSLAVLSPFSVEAQVQQVP